MAVGEWLLPFITVGEGEDAAQRHGFHRQPDMLQIMPGRRERAQPLSSCAPAQLPLGCALAV